jgi:hypothetical protein
MHFKYFLQATRPAKMSRQLSLLDDVTLFGDDFLLLPRLLLLLLLVACSC